MIYRSLLLISIIIVSSCKDEVMIPKPKAFLSLKYPNPGYNKIDNELPLSFDLNHLVKIENIVEKKDNFDDKLNCYNLVLKKEIWKKIKHKIYEEGFKKKK